MKKLTNQDKKNMDAIIRSAFSHKPAEVLKSPNNKPSKSVMEQKYKYDKTKNTFVKTD